MKFRRYSLTYFCLLTYSHLAQQKEKAEKMLVYDDLKDDASRFISQIKSLSQYDGGYQISYLEYDALIDLLVLHVPKMSMPELTSTMLSLGLICNNANSWKSNTEVAILIKYLEPRVPQLNKHELSVVTVSLARLNVNWNNDLPAKIKLSIESQISELVGSMDSKLVGDVVWSLGAMSANWLALNGKTTYSLVKSLDSNVQYFNSYALSSALWALAKMGLKWSTLPLNTRQSIPLQLLALEAEMSPQQSSKSIWALGSLGVSYSVISIELLAKLLVNVGEIKRSKMGSAIPASQTLTGLAKLGIPWSQMSASMKGEVWEQLSRVCGSTNDKGAANALWAIGTLGASVDEQPEAVVEIMLASLERIIDKCSAWSLCNIVWGLAKMKYTWPALPTTLRSALISNIIRVENDLNSMDIGLLIWSLGAMDTPLDTLPSHFSASLVKSIGINLESMKSPDLSRTIWGLSNCVFSWDSLPSAIKWSINVALRRIGNENVSMTSQDLANCAYGFSILSFDSSTPSDAAFRGVHECLLGALRKLFYDQKGQVGAFTPTEHMEQLRIFAQYLRVMSYVTDTSRIPEELLTAPDHLRPLQGSLLQDRVMASLRTALSSSISSDQISINAEASSFDGVFPVDAAIKCNGQVVALLEVDGPHHYRHDGKLRRKDKLKEAMYRKKYPYCTLYRVRWDEANKLGSDTVGKELADIIIPLAKDVQNPINNAFLNLQRSMNNFFEWGLRNE